MTQKQKAKKDIEKCYNRPCNCENREDGKNPFAVKREHEIKDKLEYKNQVIVELNEELSR